MKRHLLLVLNGLLLAEVGFSQTSTIFVTGGVNRPGTYSADSGVTVSAAIRQAGGLIAGAGSNGVIYRKDDRGVLHEIPVMLHNILDHKVTDVPLKPGDVIYVPDNLWSAGKKRPAQPVIDDRVTQ